MEQLSKFISFVIYDHNKPQEPLYFIKMKFKKKKKKYVYIFKIEIQQ